MNQDEPKNRMLPFKRAKIIIADNDETADFQAEGYATKEMLLHMFDAAVRGRMELYHQYSPEMSKWQVCNLFTDCFYGICEDVSE